MTTPTTPPAGAGRWSTIAMRIGAFTVIVDGDDHVLASGWTADPLYLTDLIHRDLRPAELLPVGDLGPISRAVRAYDQGDLASIDDIQVRQRSGPFIENAWATLRQVAPGAPISYSEFALRSGNDMAHRAAAAACARNAAALFVPCHRVCRRDGHLGGFRYGLHVKEALLDHERHHGVAAA